MIFIKLVDKYGRSIYRLRISVTSNCNLNCTYCHREGNFHNQKESYLSLEQIKKIGLLAEKYEIRSIKLTGGEPLLHPSIIDIVRIFAKIKSIDDIAMTTNGYLLRNMAHDLKNAGLDRVNIGCDSLLNESIKSLKNIAEDLRAVKKAGFLATKINMVLLKGINEHEIDGMIEFVKENGFILQIIELINTDNEYFEKYHVSLDEVQNKLEKRAVKTITRDLNDRIQYFLDEETVVELVKPVHSSVFCENCHTLRITNDFQFQPCLNRNDNFIPINSDIEFSLKEALERRKPFNGI